MFIDTYIHMLTYTLYGSLLPPFLALLSNIIVKGSNGCLREKFILQS